MSALDYISEKYLSGRCGNIGSQFREKTERKTHIGKRPGGIILNKMKTFPDTHLCVMGKT